MATRYAHIIRHRSLLLHWDERVPGAGIRNGVAVSPAQAMCWTFLRAVGQWPTEAAYHLRSFAPFVSPDGSGLCYFCKSILAVRGLAPCCANCQGQFRTDGQGMEPSVLADYGRVFVQASSLANQYWRAPEETAPLVPLSRELPYRDDSSTLIGAMYE